MADEASSPPLPLPYFLARPRGAPRAGLVVIMEGSGMTWQLLRVCERLAGLGYLVLAPEVFHRFADGHGDWDHAVRRLGRRDVLAYLNESVDLLHGMGTRKVGITGFCMGGRMSYYAATHGVDVQAAVPFYGGGIHEMLGDPVCPLLCFFGGRDRFIPPEAVEAVRARHGDDVVVYPEAEHGFMRDGSDSHHEASAGDAWARTLAFFEKHLA